MVTVMTQVFMHNNNWPTRSALMLFKVRLRYQIILQHLTFGRIKNWQGATSNRRYRVSQASYQTCRTGKTQMYFQCWASNAV